MLRLGTTCFFLATAGLATTALLVGCQPEPTGRPGPPAPIERTDPGRHDPDPQPGWQTPGIAIPTRGDCRVPNAGCACDPETDAPVECHSPGSVEDEHGRRRCLLGHRSCQAGAWGACVYDSDYELSPPGERAFGDPGTSCGNCDPACFEVEDDYSTDPGSLTGHGTDIEWDSGAGGIVIEGSGGGVSEARYAFIALEGPGRVAKIRTSDGVQVARYLSGENGFDNFPSRTAVDSDGDAYVANRAIDGSNDYNGFDGTGEWGSVTKIAGDLSRCRNGGATTSVDTNALPRGTDDCVLWTARIGNTRGSHPRGITIDRGNALHPQGIPWVGATHNVDGTEEPGRAYQLDPDDGSILQAMDLPVHVYGAAADGRVPQRIWFTSKYSGALASVNVEDGTVEGPFHAPIPNCSGRWSAYGIAIDRAGRIWRGSSDSCANYITAYVPETDSWCVARPPGPGTRGIAVRVNPDGTNTVIAANRGNPGRLTMIDPEIACVPTDFTTTFCTDWTDEASHGRFVRDTGCEVGAMTNMTRSVNLYPVGSIAQVILPAGNEDPYGVALDHDNRIWAVNHETDNIAVYDPEAATFVQYPTTGTLPIPYTYSDFTGYQRAAFTVIGTSEYFRDYGVDAPACGLAAAPVWGDLTWSAITINSRITFHIQVSHDLSTLALAPRIEIGNTDTDTSPIYVSDFVPANLLYARYIRVVAELESTDGITSPILAAMGLDWNCVESE
jgi:streptogramin lyase